MNRLVKRAVGNHDVLRIRLRDLPGHVVFSDDGSGFREKPETRRSPTRPGRRHRRLTHLNADANDTGAVGPQAVEVYVPLIAGSPVHRVGVFEVYLPYAPIDADVTPGSARSYRDLALGLGALYLALFAISVSVTRRLRRQLKVNTYLAEHDALTDLPNRSSSRSARRRRSLHAERKDIPVRHRHRRPRPVQGDQRHARPPQRRRAPHGDRPAARRPHPARRHRGPARRRRVRPRPADGR